MLEKDTEMGMPSSIVSPTHEELDEIVQHHRRKQATHWCCRPIRFQRWMIITGFIVCGLAMLGFWACWQLLELDIQFTSGRAEMRENIRIGALEQRANVFEEEIDVLTQTMEAIRGHQGMQQLRWDVRAIWEAFREVHPHYQFDADTELPPAAE